MDSADDGLLAKQFLVRINGNVGQFAVWVHLPCWVTVSLLYLCASQFKQGLDGIALVFKVAHHIAALRGNNLDAPIVGNYAGYVA